jgi:hypothetical protein
MYKEEKYYHKIRVLIEKKTGMGELIQVGA